MIFEKVYKLIDQLKDSLSQIEDIHFTTSLEPFDGATIGQHTRHVIEHFQCLISSQSTKHINYDNRKRSLVLETNIEQCCAALDQIKTSVRSYDFELEVSQDFLNENNSRGVIKSSYYREVLYNVDHLVHHQALLKIGFMQLQPHMNISKHYGYADATIKHKTNVHTELPTT